jgi:hypothetical protein
MKTRWTVLAGIALFALVLALAPLPAAAGDIGLRTGFALNPDDFVIGGHYRTPPIAEYLYFVPSAEVGFGDLTMVAFNADLHYLIDVKSKLAPYVGAGMTINWFDGENGADSQTEVGGGIIGGLMLGQTKNGRLFLEAKLGLGDVPDAKFLVGWNIR